MIAYSCRMGSGSRARVLIVADVPSPHQNVFYDAIANRRELELEVLFCRRTMPGRAWSGAGPRSARHVFCSEWALAGIPINPTLLPRLLASPHDVTFVNGYYLPALWEAGLWLGLARRPWVFWMDALTPLAQRGPYLKRLLARSARQWYLAHATAFLSTGAKGRRALLEAGVAPDRVFEIPFVVDADGIHRAIAVENREAIRRRLGIDATHRLLLFVGQMIRRKGVDLLIEAVAGLQDEERRRLRLLLIGDGADKSAFEAAVEVAGLRRQFQFLPNLDISVLPPYWAASDALVLPSRFDAWGVVVDEALTAGLPVIGSDACGAVVDRITPERNGWVFPSEDVAGLRQAIAGLVTRETGDLQRMASAARESMEPFSPDRMAEKFAMVVRETQRLAVAP
jgi:glycosyltransferase involved in cell wall biosynthesis